MYHFDNKILLDMISYYMAIYKNHSNKFMILYIFYYHILEYYTHNDYFNIFCYMGMGLLMSNSLQLLYIDYLYIINLIDIIDYYIVV